MGCSCYVETTCLIFLEVLDKTVTLGFQKDHTVGEKITRLENYIDIGSRATEMCPNIKAIDIWPPALENLSFPKCCGYFPAV